MSLFGNVDHAHASDDFDIIIVSWEFMPGIIVALGSLTEKGTSVLIQVGADVYYEMPAWLILVLCIVIVSWKFQAKMSLNIFWFGLRKEIRKEISLIFDEEKLRQIT